jgi:2-polyprenyl-3-methyl-5-hydroxy-6-metoxy-1,4-benzoquinol methylase
MKKTKLTQKEAYRLGADHQFIESIKLGPITSFSLLHDPKHMAFVLSRYKFCAKLLEGKGRVLEVGCGDAFGTPIVAQGVKELVAVDEVERLIRSNKQRLVKIRNIEFRTMSVCQEVPEGVFDAAFSIDVIEHLDQELNTPFMENQCRCLAKDGICIVGTPNITASRHASDRSRIQHINLKSHETLRKQMEKYFRTVFIFSMNDEVVHTGFFPMAHYLFGVGAGLK